MRSVYATLTAEAGCLDSLVSKSMGHTGNTVKEKNYQTVTMQALKLNASVFAEYINFKYEDEDNIQHAKLTKITINQKKMTPDDSTLSPSVIEKYPLTWRP